MHKCECGKEYPSARALATHKRIHCKHGKKVCDCADGGDWEVLTRGTPGALDFLGTINPKTGKPYKKWCTVCREVV